MSEQITNTFAHRFNDLSSEERLHLMPHLIESQILHLEQGKSKVIRAHKALIADFNSHIKNLNSELDKYKRDMKND